MPATLKIEDTGEEFTLQDFNLIGRSQDATIRLIDNGVSRQHATIRRDGKLYWLTDLGSANGSYVNEVPVTAARALRHGDQIQFGASVFVYHNPEMDITRELNGTQTQVLNTVELPVKTVQATLLVGDLKDFTAISSQLTAEEVASMLREWYAECENVLKPRGAVIDKFIDDKIFAYWPAADNETRQRSLEAATLLSSASATRNAPTRRWLRQNLGIQVICHVGLNVGPVALGAMGRGVNTAVGEAVNLTFRIESLTRKLDVPILLSSAFAHGYPNSAERFRALGFHTLKGQPDPVEVFAPIPDALLETAPIH